MVLCQIGYVTGISACCRKRGIPTSFALLSGPPLFEGLDPVLKTILASVEPRILQFHSLQFHNLDTLHASYRNTTCLRRTTQWLRSSCTRLCIGRNAVFYLSQRLRVSVEMRLCVGDDFERLFLPPSMAIITQVRRKWDFTIKELLGSKVVSARLN